MPEEHTYESNDLNTGLAQLAGEEYCYVTTTGRISGRPHEIEIWFGLNDSTLYLLSGGMDRADWVKNMRSNPSVTVRIRERTLSGMARFELDTMEETQARYMLAAKYQGWREGRKLSDWARTALPVAIDLAAKRK
jgi:deazaflavin-dependent oxidoreductase (nitroreductase family)